MRLAPHAYRELHWHTANEWSLVLKGCVQLSAMNENGQTFIDNICAGDVWFFPAGVPHSIQGLDEGSEFLLVFDDGSFSEDATFLVSELFLRNPKEVLSKDLQVPVDAFKNLPTDQLYVSSLSIIDLYRLIMSSRSSTVHLLPPTSLDKMSRLHTGNYQLTSPILITGRNKSRT